MLDRLRVRACLTGLCALMLVTAASTSLEVQQIHAQQVDASSQPGGTVNIDSTPQVVTQCINSYEVSPLPDPKLAFRCTHRVQAPNGPVEVTGTLTPVGYMPQGAIQLECHAKGKTKASCQTWYAITSPSAQEYGACATSLYSTRPEPIQDKACSFIDANHYPQRVVYP